MKKILVVGDVMLDIYHFGKVNRISPEAPVPVFLETGKERDIPGGAANVAVNIAAIGIDTEIFSQIGNDDAGNRLMKSLESKNVQTNLIYRDNEKVTTSKLRYIGPNNQQMLRADMEDVSDVKLDSVRELMDIVTQNISEYGLILLSDYKKGFLTEELTQHVIELGRNNHIPVLVDVKDINFMKYRNAYLLKPNRKELSELTGMETDTIEAVEAASKMLCQKTNCNYVLTTLGAEGMLLTDDKDTLFSSKSMAKEVFDVTGAGDTSIAYLAAELVKGKELFQAINIANHAAGVQVSKVGTSVVYPWEVEKAMIGSDNSLYRKQLNLYKEGGLNTIFLEKNEGKKVVFTNGCFDILHAGHVTYLKKAKELGDVLVVGINSDASVKRLKGETRPINSLTDRALLLAALEFVDYVVPFEEDTPYVLIKQVVPDILVKGGDYDMENIIGKDIVQEHGGVVTTIPLVEGKSTTNIINKMQESVNI